MIVSADKIIYSIKDEDISEVLIINYRDVWMTIMFCFKLIDGFYLIPCKIFYELDQKEKYIRIHTIDFTTHNKIYTFNSIKKLIMREDIKFIFAFDIDDLNYPIMQTIKLR